MEDLEMYITEVEKILTILDCEHPSDNWIKEDYENGLMLEQSARLWVDYIAYKRKHLPK